MNSTIHNVALIAAFLGAAISLACYPASTCASSICYQQEETNQKEENLQVACTALGAGEPAELLRNGDFSKPGKKADGGGVPTLWVRYFCFQTLSASRATS